jgi:WD40 repeat protein
MPGNATPIKVITGHYAPIAAMDIDWDNNKFYTGDTDGIICRWDLETCEPEQRLHHPEGNADLMYTVHSGAISGLAIAKGHLMSVGWDDKMYITEPPHTGSRVKLNPTSLGAQPVTISRGVNIAVIVTVKGLLLAKNNDGKLSDLIPIDYEPGTACVIDRDDHYVYVGGKSDHAIHIYEVINTPTEWTLKPTNVVTDHHLKPIHAMALSHDNTKLASADERDVCVLDITDATNYKPIIGRGRWCFHGQRITSLSWSPDNTVLASGGADDSIFIWNITMPMKRIHYPFAHRGGIVNVQFHKTLSKGYILYSAGVDSVVNLWDITTDVRDKFK